MEINRDVSDRKRADESLRGAEAKLAHVTRVTTLGEVTASFAHEVNQPLAAIVNNANACLGMLASERTDVYPGGWIVIPGSRRFTKYQRCSSYSRRACSSVSAT